MAYYRGDYYRGKGRGDYYRGDPGFWSAIGKGLGFVAKAVFGIPSVGAAPQPTQVATPPFSGGAGFTRLPPIPNVSLQKLPPAHIPAERLPDIELTAMRRKSRRMNPGNVKALRRSLRRVSSFGRLVKSTRKAVGQACTAVQVQRRVPTWSRRMLPAGRGK